MRAAAVLRPYLDINPMTLKLECDLDILKTYIENEVAMLRHSKVLIIDEICAMLQVKYKKIRK